MGIFLQTKTYAQDSYILDAAYAEHGFLLALVLSTFGEPEPV